MMLPELLYDFAIGATASLVASGISVLVVHAIGRRGRSKQEASAVDSSVATNPLSSHETVVHICLGCLYGLIGAYFGRNVVAQGAKGHMVLDGDGPAYPLEMGVLFGFWMVVAAWLISNIHQKYVHPNRSRYYGLSVGVTEFFFYFTLVGSLVCSVFGVPPLVNPTIGSVIGGFASAIAFFAMYRVLPYLVVGDESESDVEATTLNE